MKTLNWQLQNPIQACVFDCDGTLSKIEGIDELAKMNGVSDTIKSLTNKAMSKSGINPHLYQERLHLVSPTLEQVIALGQQYFLHQVEDAAHVIQILKRLNKQIYIVSAGLYPAIKIFAELLQIPTTNIFAVQIQFDEQGNYLDHERTSPLINNNGKCEIVNLLKQRHEGIIHIGDGLNDIVTYDLVTRFIGFGGAYYRENIAARCEYYVRAPTFAPLLPLMLTQEEYQYLLEDEKRIYQKGLAAIEEENLTT